MRSIADVVGTELTATNVVGMQCIPSRVDPVGVWIGIRVTDADVSEDRFTIGLEQTEARLGSHPSGCANPELKLAQSVFLLAGDDDSVLASAAAADGSITRLVFDLAGREPDDFDVAVLPTIGFSRGDGSPATTIFGFVDRIPLVASR